MKFTTKAHFQSIVIESIYKNHYDKWNAIVSNETCLNYKYVDGQNAYFRKLYIMKWARSFLICMCRNAIATKCSPECMRMKHPFQPHRFVWEFFWYGMLSCLSAYFRLIRTINKKKENKKKTCNTLVQWKKIALEKSTNLELLKSI